MKGSIVLGTLALLGLMGALLFVTINEVDRMRTAEAAYAARAVETGALEFESRCRSCHGPQGKGTPLAPALNTAALFDGSRLAAAGYAGTVDDFVRGTISAGRPVPSAGTNYPQRMPTWGERFGGPLRDDQVDSLVAFVMNWEDRALAEGAAAPELPADQAVGLDITQTLPTGDAARGRTLAEGTLGCAACHTFGNADLGTKPADLEKNKSTTQLAPNLRFARERMEPETIIAWILDPPGMKPGTVMPKLMISRADAELLRDFILFGDPGARP